MINDQPKESNQLESAGLSDDMQLDATPDDKAGEGTRTLNIQLGRLTSPNVTPNKSSTSETDSPTPTYSPTSSTRIDPDLQHVIAAWSALSDVIKGRIVGLVEAATLADLG